jgi:hypothetical protein
VAHQSASFRADLWRAFQKKGPVPEELAEYQIARLFWQELGVTKAELDDWDEEDLQRWLIVMDVDHRYQAAQAKMEQARRERESGGH